MNVNLFMCFYFCGVSGLLLLMGFGIICCWFIIKLWKCLYICWVSVDGICFIIKGVLFFFFYKDKR